VASDWLGVSIAPDDTLFDASPTWTRLDSGVSGLRVSSIEIVRGRSSEFEETGTGTCTVTFNDRAGVLDPTNAGSPLFGKILSRPFAVAIRNPVTDVWWPLFRGAVDDAGYNLTRSQVKLETAVVAVDAFDFFSNFELVPGLAGFANAQLNASGYVFYEDAGFDERILAILGDCGWPTALSSIFTGNIICQESVYSPGDRAMQAIREAVDAEFPTVANMYVDKRGIVQAHGRYARFEPEIVSASASNWEYKTFRAGDNAAAAADPTVAKMQEPFGFSISRKMIRNAALAYPEGVDRSDLSSFIFTDEPSRAEHGTRTWTAENLKIAEDTTENISGKAACQLFSEYIVSNYAQPHPRVQAFTIGTERPGGTFGDATWELACEVDISDSIEIVQLDHPGGGGFSEIGHFVEGLRYQIRPGPGSLDDAYPFFKMTADLSPAAYYDSSPFTPIPAS